MTALVVIVGPRNSGRTTLGIELASTTYPDALLLDEHEPHARPHIRLRPRTRQVVSCDHLERAIAQGRLDGARDLILIRLPCAKDRELILREAVTHITTPLAPAEEP